MTSNLKKPWILNFLNQPNEKSNRGLVQVLKVSDDCSYFYVSDKFHYIKARFENSKTLEAFYEKYSQYKPFNRVTGSIISLKRITLCSKTFDFIVSELEYLGIKGMSTLGEPKDAQEIFLQLKKKSQESEINLEACLIPKDQEEILRKVPGFKSVEIPLHQPSFTNLQSQPLSDSPVIYQLFQNETPLNIEYPPEMMTQENFEEDLVTQKSLLEKSQETSESEDFLEKSKIEEEEKRNQETLRQIEDLMIHYQEIPCNLNPKRFKRIRMNISVTEEPIYIETTVSLYQPLKESKVENWKKFFK